MLFCSDVEAVISLLLSVPINEIAKTTGRNSIKRDSDAAGNHSGSPAVSVRLVTASKAPQPATR